MNSTGLDVSQPLTVGVYARFKQFYRNFQRDRLDELAGIYAQDARFKDPLHEIEGLCSIHTYFADLCENLESCRFNFLDERVDSKGAYLKWDMHFHHPRLGNRKICVRGMSQLQFRDDLVVYHEDCYDMGSMLYEHLPVMGMTVRWLKQRLT